MHDTMYLVVALDTAIAHERKLIANLSKSHGHRDVIRASEALVTEYNRLRATLYPRKVVAS